MNILEPIWDNLFISDSYACRNGKGQHKGSQKCMEFVRKNKYCLKCDISKFYPLEVDDERKVLFTNSSVLKDQLEKYKDNLPFITTIIQPKKYFSFS